ncbi:MAG TPA: tetratricopeptide repeat protein [Terriglobales bacterium]|nr:tetratricopeptide repeat protein [Terriglobales bacterium]
MRFQQRALLVLLIALPCHQLMHSQSRGSNPNNDPNAPASSVAREMPTMPSSRVVQLTGRVVLDQGGSPLPERIAIQRVCGDKIVRETYTDSKGHFNFQIGQNRMEFQEASESGPGRATEQSTGAAARELWNCELRAYLPGYVSSSVSLAGRDSSMFGDLGVITLKKVNQGTGETVSSTSLSAPGDAKKAFEKSREAFEKKKLEEADKQSARAVEIYPQYAAAWDLRGMILERLGKNDEARKCYESAIAADSKYVLPYVKLASLHAAKPDWPAVLQVTETAIGLDPVSFPMLHYLRGAAFLSTGKLAEAEQSALRAVELDRERRFPRTEFLAGIILQTKGDHANAVPHFKNYLRMVPDSAEAPKIKQYLAEQHSSAATPAQAK